MAHASVITTGSLRRWVGLLAALALAFGLLVAPAAAQDVTPARVGGDNRVETAANIATLTYDQADIAHVVVGEKFPDALAASYAAGVVNGPILLSLATHDVGPVTLHALQQLGVQEVRLVGGPGVLGPEVERQLADHGYAVTRIAGEDRYATSAEVARFYGLGMGAVGAVDGQRTAVMASGANFPDALAGGPVAARLNLPLVLTPTHRPDVAVDQALEQLGIERILLLGGPGAVAPHVAQHYRNLGYTVERIAGPNRMATAAQLAERAVVQYGFSPALVLLARGDDFPDALAASVHGAVSGAPIVLTHTPTDLSQWTADWLTHTCPDIEAIRAIGGQGAVAEQALGAAVEAAQRCAGELQEVARFTTPLPHNPDRTHNVHLAADYIDGHVIAAGATYSLNQAIGERTTARGFRVVENGCIGADGQAVDCVGGGVSQNATTFMNAAWFTGIELVEFRQHSIYFPRYPVCHEATLSWGSLDVVVHNNSPYDIVIDSFYTNEFVGVRFLSHQWAHVESWAEPQSPPSGSFTAQCGRTITYPDGTANTESYTWTYDGTGF